MAARHINLNCGSLQVGRIARAGCSRPAPIYWSRVRWRCRPRAALVSHSGKIIDGDAVMLVTALRLQAAGRLTEVIATVMSNSGLERALRESWGLGWCGRRWAINMCFRKCWRRNALLGGEQSGHVIFRDYATTGDGLLTALRVFEAVRESGQNLDAPHERARNLSAAPGQRVREEQAAARMIRCKRIAKSALPKLSLAMPWPHPGAAFRN